MDFKLILSDMEYGTVFHVYLPNIDGIDMVYAFRKNGANRYDLLESYNSDRGDWNDININVSSQRILEISIDEIQSHGIDHDGILKIRG